MDYQSLKKIQNKIETFDALMFTYKNLYITHQKSRQDSDLPIQLVNYNIFNYNNCQLKQVGV